MPKPAGTILVLEDDESSRFVLRTVLESAGFSVLESMAPEAAIAICEDHQGPLQLMVADVVLRRPQGPETVTRIRELRPGLPILFISGYPLRELENRGLLDQLMIGERNARFLRKPFTAALLLTAVRQLIVNSERHGEA